MAGSHLFLGAYRVTSRCPTLTVDDFPPIDSIQDRSGELVKEARNTPTMELVSMDTWRTAPAPLRTWSARLLSSGSRDDSSSMAMTMSCGQPNTVMTSVPAQPHRYEASHRSARDLENAPGRGRARIGARPFRYSAPMATASEAVARSMSPSSAVTRAEANAKALRSPHVVAMVNAVGSARKVQAKSVNGPVCASGLNSSQRPTSLSPSPISSFQRAASSMPAVASSE